MQTKQKHIKYLEINYFNIVNFLWDFLKYFSYSHGFFAKQTLGIEKCLDRVSDLSLAWLAQGD